MAMSPNPVKPTVSLDLVAVHWLDACTGHGWEAADEAESTPHSVFTVGFVIKHNDKVIIIASSSDLQGNNNSRINIPIGMVKSIKKILVNLPLLGPKKT
jgi:hypothetical protein